MCVCKSFISVWSSVRSSVSYIVHCWLCSFVFLMAIVYQCCALVYILDGSYIPQCHHAVCVMTSLITFRVFHENIQWYINWNVFYDTLFFYLINFWLVHQMKRVKWALISYELIITLNIHAMWYWFNFYSSQLSTFSLCLYGFPPGSLVSSFLHLCR